MARWVNKMRWLIGGLGAVASLTATSSVQAQDGALTELYGYAVHRFYAGDYNEAQRALNIVIDAGVEDPRPHYFRGLVTYQMGMQDAAKSDFDHAAELEARGKAVVSISQALQRIQGPVRRDIELSRLMARVALLKSNAPRSKWNRSTARQARTSPSHQPAMRMLCLQLFQVTHQPLNRPHPLRHRQQSPRRLRHRICKTIRSKMTRPFHLQPHPPRQPIQPPIHSVRLRPPHQRPHQPLTTPSSNPAEGNNPLASGR